MNPLLRNILAVIGGWLGGSIVNMAIVQLGNKIYPIEGVDVNDMQALAEVMPHLESHHFIFPFMAHALGTLVGATKAGLIAGSHKMTFSLVIGVLFLMGGVMVNYMLPAPTWFSVLDLLVAYMPMAWIGWEIANRIQKK
ncbi:hypothetical protein [Mariniflexile sp. AS56]|uniref:hypothetical protein n=1 Tax=Mariniflexile sp. AS56 TaxID=3063957 RepID=UPI0026EBA9C8|nr:hypothetical protein [Mariniflexile sp. AS56]MDO7171144.1 hypothetical protein [Mariniflexile sp. AS56]